MTDRQPEPTTETGRRYLNILAPVSTTPDGIRDREETAADIIAIEAEAHTQVYVTNRTSYLMGVADERERLAEAVRTLPHIVMLDPEHERGNWVKVTAVIALLQPDTASES